jgi:hypothetical protein
MEAFNIAHERHWETLQNRDLNAIPVLITGNPGGSAPGCADGEKFTN